MEKPSIDKWFYPYESVFVNNKCLNEWPKLVNKNIIIVNTFDAAGRRDSKPSTGLSCRCRPEALLQPVMKRAVGALWMGSLFNPFRVVLREI